MGSDELVNREAKGVNSHSIVYSWIRLPLSTEHVLGSRKGILVLRRVEDKVTRRRAYLKRRTGRRQLVGTKREIISRSKYQLPSIGYRINCVFV
jgi:hypothetical protein